MLCTVIKGPTLDLASLQIEQAQKLSHLVELRLDIIQDWNIEQLKNLRKDFPIGMIFTLRPVSQGGMFSGPEEERLKLIEKLSEINPEYMDLEYSIPVQNVRKLKEQHPRITFILSFHDFEKMPPLDPVLEMMRKIPADLYKISVTLHSSSEALILLDFMKSHSAGVLAMGMGRFGYITRILSPLFGGKLVYASLDLQTGTARDRYLYRNF